MIYLTGDMHGDPTRLEDRAVKRLRRGDTLIVCGDFGFLWDGSSEEEKQLRRIARRRCRILFVEGCHDNLTLLARYPVVDFCGGRAHQIADNLYHLMRGEVFSIEGHTFFAFGGGESLDHDIREEGRTWWAEEMPTDEELERGRRNLAAHDNRVEFIVSHEAPASVANFIRMDGDTINRLNTYFDAVTREVSYNRWYFGCYHLDRAITPTHIACFREVQPLR